MKNDEFHVPFVKNLLLICVVTIVSMISARFFIHNYFYPILNSPQYTSHESYNEAKAGE